MSADETGDYRNFNGLLIGLVVSVAALACGQAEPLHQELQGSGGARVDGTGGTGGVDAAPDVGDPGEPPAMDGGTSIEVVPNCSDGLQNGMETDVDCGGPDCAPCSQGLKCVVPRDCVNRVCTDAICQSAACGDGIANGRETDVDCGGSDCTKCGDGKGCLAGTDCQSAICANGTCQVPTCSDNVRNGAETDTDCGGPVCDKCSNGRKCGTDADCMSAVCHQTCQSASCADRVKNGSETDVDCGGTCSKCSDGKTCALAGDCTSGVCNVTCQTASCSDSVRNGGETDVDCGGGMCPKCADGDRCMGNSDCTSNVCSSGSCQAPSCTDGIKNGTETDIDCGGTCARKCDVGQGCGVNADCMGNVCTSGTCRAPWRVQYKAGDTSAMTLSPKPFFQIVSSGGAPTPLTEFVIRYWYTQDTVTPQQSHCDYAQVGCNNISIRFQTMATPRPGADIYMDVTFTDGAGSLTDSTRDIQTRFNGQTYPTYTQTGDYSFDPTKTTYADWDHVALYHNGTLVWGHEP
jgi:hypothetical protein